MLFQFTTLEHKLFLNIYQEDYLTQVFSSISCLQQTVCLDKLIASL